MIPSVAGSHEPLSRGDYLLLLACCSVLYLLALVPGRTLSGHSAVVPQTAREMIATRDWIVPRAGGEPWIERPPLSAWVIAGVNTVFRTSTNDRVARLAAVLAAIPTVMLVAWIAAVFFGRTIARLSALIMATCWEFYTYASNPEADIFLCLAVTGTVALFVRLEFGSRPSGDQPRQTLGSPAFLAGRSWLVLAFFIVLGLTNLAKGLVFGTLVALIPIGGYLLLSGDWPAIRRYVWFWGWLAFLAVSLPWPAYVALHYPEALAFWDASYLGRLYRGYLAEPFWYYGPATLRNLLPWTLGALAGLWITRRAAIEQPRSPQRFLWAWALLPPLVLSIPNGKHHHYMLHSLAPFAILAALGTVRLWELLLSRPSWLHAAYGPLVVGLPAVAAILIFSDSLRGPSWIAPVLAASAMVLVSLASFFTTRPDGRWAMGGTFAVLTMALTLVSYYQARYIDDYHDDLVFLDEVRRMVPQDRLLLGQWDTEGGLESFWLMFYGDARMKMIHTPRDIADALGDRQDAYIVARRLDQRAYATIGRTEEVLASRHTRSERFPSPLRRVLYHFTKRERPGG